SKLHDLQLRCPIRNTVGEYLHDNGVTRFQFGNDGIESFHVGDVDAIYSADKIALAECIRSVGDLNVGDIAFRIYFLDDDAFLTLELVAGCQSRRQFGKRQTQRVRIYLRAFGAELSSVAVLTTRAIVRRSLAKP